MSFQPVLPLGGYGGWRFLDRTLASQQDAFSRSPEIRRDTEYFRQRIGAIDSAEDLVADRRLLRVALGAFGLQDDIDNRYFVRRILEDGTTAPGALANRLADKRYLEFSRAFGFGDFPIPRTRLSSFGADIAGRFEARQFEVSVGRQDESLRLALGSRRELSELAAGPMSERAKWFTVMGTPPLRQVFETAYGLPASFATLDLDRQLGVLQQRTRQSFGADSVSQFGDPTKLEGLARRFLLQAEARAIGPMAQAGAVALQLLQAGQSGIARAGPAPGDWRGF